MKAEDFKEKLRNDSEATMRLMKKYSQFFDINKIFLNKEDAESFKGYTVEEAFILQASFCETLYQHIKLIEKNIAEGNEILKNEVSEEDYDSSLEVLNVIVSMRDDAKLILRNSIETTLAIIDFLIEIVKTNNDGKNIDFKKSVVELMNLRNEIVKKGIEYDK